MGSVEIWLVTNDGTNQPNKYDLTPSSEEENNPRLNQIKI